MSKNQTKNKKNETEELEVFVPGYTDTDMVDVTDYACMGWYKPGICGPMVGRSVGVFAIEDGKGGFEKFVKIELAAPLKCVSANPESEEKTESVNVDGRIAKLAMRQPGEIVGFKVRNKAAMVLEYELGTKFVIETGTKVPIRGGQNTMWNFNIKVQKDAKKLEVPLLSKPVIAAPMEPSPSDHGIT